MADGPRVGLLYDSVSANTGDIAIGIAGQQELARHGIHDVVVLDPFDPYAQEVDAVVVGGGELIRPVGDSFYDTFRPRDGAILNAAGVWQTADALEYLADYEYVSARSSAEAAVLRQYVPDVRVLPCTTTTLEGTPYDLGLDADEPLVGIHLVPHTVSLCPDLVDIIDAIPHRKVFIPFTHYNYDDSFMRALPFDRSRAVQLPRLDPLQLHSVVGQMTYVVTSSLHASLFAYSQNVPFVTAHQEKVVNYFGDRGLGRFVFASDDQLRQGIAALQSGNVDFADIVAQDRAAVHDAYAEFARIIHRRAARPRPTAAATQPRADAPPEPATDYVEHMRAEQRAHVIENRDIAVHHLTRRLMAAQADAVQWHREADRLTVELAHVQATVERLLAARAAATQARSGGGRRPLLPRVRRVVGRVLRRLRLLS